MARKKAKRTTKRRGRPKGSGGPPAPVEVVEPSRCPKCGSTERSPYFGTVTRDTAGVYQGKPFDRIVRHRTRCGNCGQTRVDKEYHFRARRVCVWRPPP